MFGGFGINEILVIVALIVVLSMTGLWPKVVRGLRELRGENIGATDISQDEAEVLYTLLGVSPSSSWETIEKAYRAKAKVHHPDHGGDEDAMRALNNAYTKLKQLRGA